MKGSTKSNILIAVVICVMLITLFVIDAKQSTHEVSAYPNSVF